MINSFTVLLIYQGCFISLPFYYAILSALSTIFSPSKPHSLQPRMNMFSLWKNLSEPCLTSTASTHKSYLFSPLYYLFLSYPYIFQLLPTLHNDLPTYLSTLLIYEFLKIRDSILFIVLTTSLGKVSGM